MHERRLLFSSIVVGALFAMLLPRPLPAMDVDVPKGDDCARDLVDFGDAPEGFAAYPSGVVGKFPTCIAPGLVGAETGPCPFPGPAPGPAGYVKHVQSGPGGPGNFWLGCYADASGFHGIDAFGEIDGKTNLAPAGVSFCNTTLTTDCVEPAWGGVMLFDQDECYVDGSDAGIKSPLTFIKCKDNRFTYEVYNCGNTRQVYLNVLLDENEDGDWNDSFFCGPRCACEWAVLNTLVTLLPGCNAFVTPDFLVADDAAARYAWMRISISTDPAPLDFRWNGSVSAPGGVLVGGETEDYPVALDREVPSREGTWGRVKTLYR